MRPVSHKTSCLTLVLLLLLMVGCGFPGALRRGARAHRPPSILKSNDKVCQISLPEGWAENRKLHDSAELQAANEFEEMYVIILPESKEDFQEMTIARHSETTRQILQESLTAPRVNEPLRSTIGGHPSLQYEIRGTAKNLNVVYLHTTVETDTRYYQILAWTLSSKYTRNRSTLLGVVESFRELDSSESGNPGGTS